MMRLPLAASLEAARLAQKENRRQICHDIFSGHFIRGMEQWLRYQLPRYRTPPPLNSILLVERLHITDRPLHHRILALQVGKTAGFPIHEGERRSR
jgi:hypothetical protein